VRSSLVGSSTREVVKAIASLPLPPAAAPADTRLTKGLTAMIVMEMAGSAAPARGAREDEVFPFLLNEALFSPIEDVRIYTSMLLRASPYAAPTATALSELVRRPDALTNASLMMSVMPVLRVLGSDAQIPILQDLVLDESVPAPVRARAAYSLGHVGTAADDPPAYWATNVGWTRSGAATLLRRYAKSPSGGATYPPRLWPARGSDRP
ncbi:MAG: hypothetical protein ACRDP1_11145, partial [Nocardioidaceae bacterium]